MNKKSRIRFTYWFLIFLMLGASSCTRKICPAYFSTFNHSPDAANKFFSYFEIEEVEGSPNGSGGAEDSDIYASSDSFFDTPASDEPMERESPTEAYVPKRDSLKTPNGMLIFQDADEPSRKPIMAGRTRTKTGLVKKPSLFSQIFSNPEKRRAKNRPKVVVMKTKPEKGKGEEADSTELPYPPEYFEQYYYEIGLGTPAQKMPPDTLQQENPELPEGELEEGYEYVTDKKGRLKKKKIKKKKRKKDKGEKEEAEESEEKPKKQKKKKKKNKKEEEAEEEEGAESIP